jgi:KipI family sensor histidine kinase inhibitor
VRPVVTPFGDTAVLATVDDTPSAHLLARRVERARRDGRAPDGVEEAVVGLRSVVVLVEPTRPVDEVADWLVGLTAGAGAGSDISDDEDDQPARGEHHQIPVTFDGEDLRDVADQAGIDTGAVVSQLTGTSLRVAFLGFSPGFAYLDGLPGALAAVPRLPSPRRMVPAGSVAVGGGFAAVYPSASPGGWRLLGRTSLPLFDPSHPPYARLLAGDTVRFIEAPMDGSGPPPSPPEERPPLTAAGDRLVRVLEPGLLSLIQDAGRRETANIGVPRAGPADSHSMRLANRLVGNPDDAAVIEMTAIGPRLEVAGDLHVGVVAGRPEGAEVSVDGRPVVADTVVPVHNGQVFAVGRVVAGLRAYLAVSGGFATPTVVGSRSSDLLSGLGTGRLRTGDHLTVGRPTHPHGQILPAAVAPPDGVVTVRILPGPHRIGHGLATLTGSSWQVKTDSSRIGIRLHRPEGPGMPHAQSIPSLGMVEGAVQVPPDGDPIVLGPDHATVGGYPVIACVIAADLPLLGQVQPGDALVFAVVDRPAAHRAFLQGERSLARRVQGWFPTETVS